MLLPAAAELGRRQQRPGGHGQDRAAATLPMAVITVLVALRRICG
jgi:hypothetical protein